MGYTANSIESRLQKHNAKHKGFTGKTDDWQVVCFETYDSKTAAMKREKKIKSWKFRNKLEAFVKASRP